MKNLLQRLANLPVGVVATAVGAATLSNVYLALGFTWIRHLTMGIGFLVLIAMLYKIIRHFQTFKTEYTTVVPSSLYATVTMLTMILGSYVFDFNAGIGRLMWFIGVFAHMTHILVFTYRNVVRGVKIETFIPSWFVTYNGLLVSAVIGGAMNANLLLQGIVWYGIAVFLIIIPFMIYRLIKKPLPTPLYPTLAILLAPSSLCLVGYINVMPTKNPAIIFGLYGIILVTLLVILVNIPRFFKQAFHPGFAALTFPMAIGIVASTKMTGYLTQLELPQLASISNNVAGIQIVLTTAIIAFVAYSFSKLITPKTAE